MRRLVAIACGCAVAAPAFAGEPVAVSLPTEQTHRGSEFRLPTVIAPADPTFKLDDPQSKLATGYGGSLINLFPFAGGKFHFSAGPRLFGAPGRPGLLAPESLQYLPAFRGSGMRMSRRMAPAMMIGYGKPLLQGFSLGVDGGVIDGKIVQGPDRVGHFNRSRVDAQLAGGGRGAPSAFNPLARLTALYRF